MTTIMIYLSYGPTYTFRIHIYYAKYDWQHCSSVCVCMSVDKVSGIMASDVRRSLWNMEQRIMGSGDGSQRGPSLCIISFLCYHDRSWWQKQFIVCYYCRYSLFRFMCAKLSSPRAVNFNLISKCDAFPCITEYLYCILIILSGHICYLILEYFGMNPLSLDFRF